MCGLGFILKNAWRSFETIRWNTCDLQGSKFGHVVKAGDRDAADVVVVQCSASKREKNSHIVTTVLSFLYFISLNLSLLFLQPTGNTPPHFTQMGSPRTSHTCIQSCMQICTHI